MVSGASMLDSRNAPFILRGVQMTGLNIAVPGPADAQRIASMTPLTFRAIRQRWNMNALRLPLSIPVWRRDGTTYVNAIVQTTRAANQEQLVVVTKRPQAFPVLTRSNSGRR
jgi:hypothetical protein